jgi:hypothetical protein
MKVRPALLCKALVLGLAAGVLPCAAADGALQDSPFSAADKPAAEVAGGSLRLSGISVIGGKTYVSIYDGREKMSRWIAVGGVLGDIEVVSCDTEKDRSVVRVAGELKVLDLQKPAVVAGAAPALDVTAAAAAFGAQPAESAGVVPASVISPAQAEEEREARMLVTDLLEISIQQRKAYEDAQKTAAAAKQQPNG